jgi:hypothetical protein
MVNSKSCCKGVLSETNLAGIWQFQPEAGAWTTIKVPGGGWLKQGFDCEAATYQRRITIPDCGHPQDVRNSVQRIIRETNAFQTGGIFIGSSSEINPPIKVENFRAMVAAVGEYRNDAF